MCSSLPPYRVDRSRRYIKRSDRVNCIVSYYLLSRLLDRCHSMLLPSEPLVGRYGKPLSGKDDIKFSISHCEGAVCCGVTDVGDIGVDIERKIGRSSDLTGDVLSPVELEQYYRERDPDGFFTEIWTRKEAYLKMLGTGISDEMSAVDTNDLHHEGRRVILNTSWTGDLCVTAASVISVRPEMMSARDLLRF
ncbi:MAG: 4'-phosphopantetheinyl transferase superfamily protein [Saccharofermentans sp.]|nr:4'-phosphopantetheinyl transferase superfamily protein [Saccharofermentans sp.]